MCNESTLYIVNAVKTKKSSFGKADKIVAS